MIGSFNERHPRQIEVNEAVPLQCLDHSGAVITDYIKHPRLCMRRDGQADTKKNRTPADYCKTSLL